MYNNHCIPALTIGHSIGFTSSHVFATPSIVLAQMCNYILLILGINYWEFMSTGSFKLRNTVYKNEHSSTLMGGMAINKSSQKSKCSNQFLARYFPALNSYVTLLAVKLCELIAFSRPHLNCEA